MRRAVFLPTLIIMVLGLTASGAPSLRAADGQGNRTICLNAAEQHAAIEARRAIPLAEAIRRLHTHRQRGEVVRARLCRHGEGLAYMLTLLSRSGKVTSPTVDAANGELINGR